ncbi:MAG: ABC transporter permease [Bacteroidota bacterium]
MIANYIKIAWKVLLRHPFYTFITLFGISLTLTVLMVLTSFLDHLFGSHYPETNRYRTLYIHQVVMLDSLKQSSMRAAASYNFLQKYVKSLKTPEKVSITTRSLGNTYIKDRRLGLNMRFADANFWEMTNFEFLEGKPFNEEIITKGEKVAIISDDLKRQYFDNSPQSVLGKTIEVDKILYRVIGVVKAVPATRQDTSADIYIPTNSNYESSGFIGSFNAFILAHSSADIPTIQHEYQQAISRIPLPQMAENFKVYHVESSADTYLEYWKTNISENILTHYIFIVAPILMLFFVGLPAINLVNLNVGRMMERASEIGIRKAFGAPIQTLIWQFIIENIFITFLGGIIALFFSAIIIYLINDSGWIAHSDLTINFSVFAISFLICLVFGFLSGVVPALRMSKLNIVEALKAA